LSKAIIIDHTSASIRYVNTMSGEVSKEDRDGSKTSATQEDGPHRRQPSSSRQDFTGFAINNSIDHLSSSPTYVSSASSGNISPSDKERRTTIDNPATIGSGHVDGMHQHQSVPGQLYPFNPMYDSEESDSR
jgi:hypothetical protein